MADKKEKTWICSVCGYVHKGPEPPQECPVCKVKKEYFDEADTESQFPG